MDNENTGEVVDVCEYCGKTSKYQKKQQTREKLILSSDGSFSYHKSCLASYIANKRRADFEVGESYGELPCDGINEAVQYAYVQLFAYIEMKFNKEFFLKQSELLEIFISQNEDFRTSVSQNHFNFRNLQLLKPKNPEFQQNRPKIKTFVRHIGSAIFKFKKKNCQLLFVQIYEAENSRIFDLIKIGGKSRFLAAILEQPS